MPIAVASNSDRWRLEVVLSAAGVRHLFDVTVAGDEVVEPKPAPDIYLRAAELLGIGSSRLCRHRGQPHRCRRCPRGRDDRRGRPPGPLRRRGPHRSADRIVDSLDEI